VISIIVPVYDAEEYIGHCIESILQQTYCEWELILIDNGSTDESYQVCRKYAQKDERIFVYHQYRNQGVSAARNLGKEKANGEFITFIDADDWVRPDFLQNLICSQKKEHADMVICGYDLVYDSDRMHFLENLKEKSNSKKKDSEKVYMIEQYIEEYLLEGNTHCWGVLYYCELLEDIKFPQGITIGEDLLFLIEVALNARKIVISDYQGYQYYVNQKGAMMKKFTASYMDQIRCWELASEKILKMYPRLESKMYSILLVSAMLVVGKISELEKQKQKEYEKELEECRCLVKEYGSRKETIKLLPKGYFIKTFLFRHMPEVYMKLYQMRKKRVS